MERWHVCTSRNMVMQPSSCASMTKDQISAVQQVGYGILKQQKGTIISGYTQQSRANDRHLT